MSGRFGNIIILNSPKDLQLGWTYVTARTYIEIGKTLKKISKPQLKRV